MPPHAHARPPPPTSPVRDFRFEVYNMISKEEVLYYRLKVVYRRVRIFTVILLKTKFVAFYHPPKPEISKF